jgi:hypothetical protein
MAAATQAGTATVRLLILPAAVHGLKDTAVQQHMLLLPYRVG